MLLNMKNELGLVHIYCGDGKGKTTAAMGIALRGIGCGFNVLIVQFLKDGDSSELKPLSSFPNVTVFSGKEIEGFTFSMTDEDKQKVYAKHNQHLKNAITLCNEGKCDILILDEAIGAMNMKLMDCEMLTDFLKAKPCNVEVIMTGRNPSDEIASYADYISEISKVKHPYDKGIQARNGVEM